MYYVRSCGGGGLKFNGPSTVIITYLGYPKPRAKTESVGNCTSLRLFRLQHLPTAL